MRHRGGRFVLKDLLHMPERIYIYCGSMILKRRIYERQCTRIIQYLSSISLQLGSAFLHTPLARTNPCTYLCPSLSLSSHPSDSSPSSIQTSPLHDFSRIIYIHGQERRGISIQLWVSPEGLPFRVLSHRFVPGSSSRPISKIPDGTVQERHLLLEVCFWH